MRYNKYDNTVPLQVRLDAQIDKSGSCWVWTGYKRGVDRDRGAIGFRGKQVAVPRVMWEVTYGKIPDGLFVCHHCDNSLCVKPSHLFLGTQADNVADMIQKGRQASPELTKHLGEENGAAKLTEADVRRIRAAYKNGRRGVKKMLAEMFGVSSTMIRNVVERKSWRHVK